VALERPRNPEPEQVQGPKPRVIGLWQERVLADANRTRSLLGSLIDGDWLGLHLLALLRSLPQRAEDLAAKTGTEEVTLSPVLSSLVQSGVVEEREAVFSCTGLGAETLLKIETATGVSMRP
jgi:hypothetical protein